MDGAVRDEILAQIQADIAAEWEAGWAEMQAKRKAEQAAKLRDYIPARYRNKSFEDFDRTAQADAYDKAKAYSEALLEGSLADADRPSLMLMGTTGTGKTHLAAAITNAAIAAGKEAIFGTWDDHTDRLKDDFNNPDADYLNKLKSAELLVIDDLYDYDQSSWEQKTMFKVINARTADGLATVITTNLTPAQIESAFGQRIASRLKGSCRISMMQGKDYRVYRG